MGYVPGDPTTKNKVSIEQRLNSSPARHNWSLVSIRKNGGGDDFDVFVVDASSSAAEDDRKIVVKPTAARTATCPR